MSETQDAYGNSFVEPEPDPYGEPVPHHFVATTDMIDPTVKHSLTVQPVRNSRITIRELPASEEAEQHVIACCLLDGAETGAPTLQRALLEGIRPDSFYWPANQTLFAVMSDLNRRNLPANLETLAEELSTTKQLEHIGGFPYLLQVTGKVPTTAHAGYFIEKVREKSLLRATIRQAHQTIEDAYAFTGGLDEFLQVASARQEAIKSGTAISKKADAEAKLATHRIFASKAPVEPQTRLYLAGKPIATPGNLVTMISRAKTGKTAALGAATAAIIAATTSTLDRDTFKFRASNPNGHAVIILDTEQSPYDAYLCYKRALVRAGHDVDPHWLHHYSLVGYTPAQLHEALDIILATCAKTHHGIFAVILDGCADFVASVNDEAECNGFVTWLRARTVTYDCPAICVIHSNEGDKSGDDGRGHLGKQLIRKAESNLLLKKTGDVTVITSDKQRKAPITEADGVAFQWDDEAQMHVSCGAPESSARAGRPKTYDFSDISSAFPKSAGKAMTRQQVYRYVQEIAPIKESTFRNLLIEAVNNREVARLNMPDGPVYHLPEI